MNVLFTGRGTSGSWQCRGVQLGGELGDVIPKATDFTGYDLVVLVKRPAKGQIEAIKRSGLPWVWDVVDFYPQPICTKWPKDKAVKWVRDQIDAFDPNAVIWPNRRMAQDCYGPRRHMVLYHHYRPGLCPRSVEDRIRTVGYEGSPKYLGRWLPAIRKACKRRGWRFTTEGTPQDFDACVAFRDDAFNGYAQKHWKSNVKLANCHGAGVPFIGASEFGYMETATGHEIFCDDILDLDQCLDLLTDERRRKAQAVPRYSVQQAAEHLHKFLNSVYSYPAI